MNTAARPRSATPLWRPTQDVVERANVTAYMRWLSDQRGISLTGYHALWRWSVQDLPGFWSSIWDYYGLHAVSGYQQVLADSAMPGARWFTGARLNFARECLRHATTRRPALISVAEDGCAVETSWEDLRQQTAALAATLRDLGVGPGDRVAGYLPNIAETVVALLAAASVGAIWTACSPDFGIPSVLARLQQAAPVVLIAATGYTYGGQRFDRRPEITELTQALPTLRAVLTVNGSGQPPDHDCLPAAGPPHLTWQEAVLGRRAVLEFADTDFDHPLWILWSSGTTGSPKGIVHGHGGIVLELLKALGLGADLRPGDRYLFITSTSWMVWNFLVGGLLHGCTIILYNGSPTYPDVNAVWRIAEQTRASVVGAGAGYLMAGQRAGARPGADYDLAALRSILQTGSPLPTDAWEWTYRHVKPDVWLQSVCGGTDVCSALAGGTPLLPVYPARIQAPALGVALAAWDSRGNPVVGEEGELVVTAPMPSMPLYFWNDPDGARYHDSYFGMFPGIWRHGDWVTIDSDGSVVVSGRSDATLNRMGIRMGSADIYAVVERLPEIADSLVIGTELGDGGYFMPLFVVTAPGAVLDDALRGKVNQHIRTQLSPRHVPDTIIEIPAVPRTLTGKKLEIPVKRIVQGTHPGGTSPDGGVTHPEMLAWFARYAASLRSASGRSSEP
jgi:acetoacetyl-CoA synthetase